MQPEARLGIQALLLRVFLPVVALAALLIALFVYNRLDATILRQFDERLIATSALTGAMVDPADHDWLIQQALRTRDGAAVERDPRYRRNVEPMQRVRERLDLTYIYTQVANEAGGVRYILDGTEGEEHTLLGSPDMLPAETMAGLREVQTRARVYVSPVEYQEQWGLLKTAAAPVYSVDGRISGTAGADVNVSLIRVATQKALFLSAMVGIASLLACLLVTLQIVRRVARPIERLTQDALRIAAGDRHPPTGIASPDDVRGLRDSLHLLNGHVTAELDEAMARAAEHRLAASRARLLSGDRGVVMLAREGDRQWLWLPNGSDRLAETFAMRAMAQLRERIAARPDLLAAAERLADVDHGSLLLIDRGAGRLCLVGGGPIELEAAETMFTLAPGESADLSSPVAELRHRGAFIAPVREGR